MEFGILRARRLKTERQRGVKEAIISYFLMRWQPKYKNVTINQMLLYASPLDPAHSRTVFGIGTAAGLVFLLGGKSPNEIVLKGCS